MDVGLERVGDVPLARREVLDTGQRLVARPLELGVVELLREVGIGVDDADHRRGHEIALPGCPRSYVAARTASRAVVTRRRTVARMDIERIEAGLAVRGELDAANAEELDVALQEALLETEGAFVLDLGGLTFMDSAGVTELLRARSLLGREERSLVVRCPDGPVRRVLDLVGIAELFELDTG